MGDVKKVRIDRLLVERGLAESRSRAAQMIALESVRVEGQLTTKPGTRVDPAIEITVCGDPLPYVGRGGNKLAYALQTFLIAPAGKIALDVGASTGGFTQVLLRAGVAQVYAVDVGRNQIHESLRTDSRVIVMEQTDIRSIIGLPNPPEVVTIDVSFISLTLVLPAVMRLMAPKADIITLIKPQFEVGPEGIGKRGVVRDARLRLEAIERVRVATKNCGLYLRDIVPSPITGADGNVEYLAHWHPGMSLGETSARKIRAAVSSTPHGSE